MEKHHKFSMWYILLGIWVVLIIQNAIFSAFSVKTIPYSEFLKALNEDRVTEVAITSNIIQGRMRSTAGRPNAQLFRTVRVDPELSELLGGAQRQVQGRDRVHLRARPALLGRPHLPVRRASGTS